MIAGAFEMLVPLAREALARRRDLALPPARGRRPDAGVLEVEGEGAMRCPVPRAKWRRGRGRGHRGWLLDVGPHQYTVLWIGSGDRDFLRPIIGDAPGHWIYAEQPFRTLKQAKARAEDDALDRLRKEAADLGLRVVEERSR